MFVILLICVNVFVFDLRYAHFAPGHTQRCCWQLLGRLA